MWKVKREVLMQVCASARNFYPKEFMCFLAGDKKTQTLTEIVLLPNTSGNEYASILETVIPIDDTIIASVHSHPAAPATPSAADKKFFMKYAVNGIIDGTYTVESIRFYDSKGKPLVIAVE